MSIKLDPYTVAGLRNLRGNYSVDKLTEVDAITVNTAVKRCIQWIEDATDSELERDAMIRATIAALIYRSSLGSTKIVDLHVMLREY